MEQCRLKESREALDEELVTKNEHNFRTNLHDQTWKQIKILEVS